MVVGKMYRDLIQTDYFRVVVVDDVEAVEVCGALKVRLDGSRYVGNCCYALCFDLRVHIHYTFAAEPKQRR